jgi:hypothetical protein
VSATRNILLIFIFTALLASCKKTNSSNANVLLYNASWSLPAVSADWNGNNIAVTPLAQGQGSRNNQAPYLQVPAGTNLVTLKSGNDTLVNKNIYTAAAGGNSFIFFDTSTSKAPARVLQLIDDLTPPDTARIKYRFINFSPDTAATADLWLVNGSTDSLQIKSNIAFAGSLATASGVPAFEVPDFKYRGQAYTIKIKKTGTGIVLASITDYVFAVRGIYSIIFSGLSTGTGATGLKLSVLHHAVQ